MAVPLQYQSQFIPTDFGTLGNIVGQFRQDMQQRNQEFDQSQAMRDQAIAQVYGIETLDPEIFQQAGDTLSKQIDEVVNKRGGDYGAAAGDISRLVAQESRKPIYGLNKRKLEQVKQLEQAIARNPNLLALQDPRQIDLTQKGLSPEDIAYSVLDPKDIETAISDIYGDLAKQRREGLPTFDPKSGYNVATTTLGVSPQEAQQMLQDEQTYQTVLSRFPQLAPYMDNEVINQQLRARIGQGVQGLVGGQTRQFLRPLEPTSPPSNLNAGAAIGSLYTPSAEVEPKIYKKASKTQEEVQSIINIEGNVTKPEGKRASVSRPFTGMYGIAPALTQEETQEDRAYKQFKKYTEAYPVLYERIKKTGGNDSDFLNTVTQIEKDKAYILESRIGFNDPKFTEYLTENLAFNKAQLYEVNDEGKITDKDIKWNNYNSKFKNAGLTYKDSKVFMTPKGDVVLQDPEGKQYAVNPSSFPTVTRKYLQTIGDVFDAFYDYDLKPDQVEAMNNPKAWYNLGANIYAKVVIPENDVMNKKIVITYPDDTGKQVMRDDLSIDQFYGYMSKLVNADVFKGK